MYLFGASGHAKVIIEILEDSGLLVEGLLDDNPEIKKLIGYQVSTPDYSVEILSNKEFIISIGDNKIRKTITQRYNLNFINAIHPSAVISKRINIGSGNVIMPQAVINTGTNLGNHVIINTSASVDHDCVIEDFVHISPNVALCGSVYVGEGTHIGAGAVVIPGIRIGKWCTIGAGAVIIKDVPNLCTVVGNPGRIIK